MPDAMTVITWAAAANASHDAAEARAAAERAECMERVRGYVHDTATAGERREYARCMQVLYPNVERSETDDRGTRVMIGCVLLAWFAIGVIGGIVGWVRSDGDSEEIICHVGGFMMLLPLALAVIFILLLPFFLIFG